MNLLYIVPTFQRPKVLSRCLETLLSNGHPDELWILDDGSDPGLRHNLVEFQVATSQHFPTNLVLCGRNYGIGWNFENIFNIIRWKNPKYYFLVESDYIFRKGFLDDVNAVFDADPYVVALPGCDHPDMYQKEKTHGTFPNLMREQFPTDVAGREHMYIPYDLETKVGKIQVFGASNSCGCMFVHWERFQNILRDLNAEKEYWGWMDRAFNKQPGGDRRNASDQHLSCSISWYWTEWAKKHNIDITKHFPFLNICDFSIASHICGGGCNAGGYPEGTTFVGAPHWNVSYTLENPRKKQG